MENKTTSFVFDKIRLERIFKIMNKNNVINLVWKGDNSIKGLCLASKSGHGSNLFDKLQPTSYEDFYFKLNQYALNNQHTLPIYDRGLVFNELYDLAVEFKTKVELLDKSISFKVEDYIDYIEYVNVIQTFDGHINEVMLVNYIKKSFYKDAHKANGMLDSKYGIDILYRNDTRGIQVKSLNFFLGNKQSTVNDRNNILPLKDEVKEKFNIEMYYAIFDRKNGAYLQSSNGTPIFKFDEFYNLLQSSEYNKIFKYKHIKI
jgi:hypothetical protein